MSTRLLTVCALSATMLASQAFASGTNEYTLSDTDTSTTITSYQPQATQQTFQTQPSYQTQPAYQPPAADTNNSQFGELVFDTQPYMPNGDTGSTQAYTTNTTESYTTDTFTTQPYTGATDTTYQPAYQATETAFQNTQQAYQPSQNTYQEAEPAYQPPQQAFGQYGQPIQAQDESSWK